MEVDGGPTTRGREALAEMVRRTPYGIVHVTVDAIVEVDGDRAVQDVTLLVVNRPSADTPPEKRRSRLQRTGRYHDVLVRTPDGYRPNGLARAVFGEHVKEMTVVEFLAVIKTGPGTANLVAWNIDHASVPGVAGTVAGDDTIIVVLSDRAAAKTLRRMLQVG